MGKAAHVVKERKCILCEQILTLDSGGLKEHFRLCVRAKRSGLILPGVSRPKEIELVKLYE